MVWKFRGAPADRPDRRQLGNEHLVSFWPVRGGPAVDGGVVYFGAGIWPTFGVFVHALDAETGRPKWTNAGLNYVAPVRIDHDGFAEVGMSPQGYFVALPDRILVPNSRAMPAALNRGTGKLTYYMQGCRRGDSRVAAHGGYAFVGKEGVLELGDLREVGSRWAGCGGNKPQGYRGPVLRAEDLAALPRVFPHWGYNADWDLYECPLEPYKVAEGCDASSAFENHIAYGSAKGIFYACNLATAHTTPVEKAAFYGIKIHPLQWQPEALWQFKTSHHGQPGGTVIKAGKRLYGYAGSTLIALENLDKQPRLAWERQLAGRPTSLVAADHKLFVATAEGTLYCFGQPSQPPTAAKTYAAEPLSLEARLDAWSAKAGQIVKTSGVTSGYCLVLGLGDGRLTEELVKQTELIVLGVDRDAAKVERLRRRFDAAGLLGSRVELFAATPAAFGFPPYLASLIVSEDAEAAGLSARLDAAKLFDVLRPYGGTLCLERPPESHPALLDWTRAAALAKAVVKHEGRWSLLVRDGPLPGAASWTHEAADAACTFTSQDDLVRAPLGILWYGDESGFSRYKDYNHAVKPQVSDGRVYAIVGGTLVAYDAYTGRPLWSNPFHAFASHARFAATEQAIYFVADGKCTAHDPATGKRLQTFTFNAASATTAKDLRVGEGVVVVASTVVTERDVRQESYENYGLFDSRQLVCLDCKAGTVLWRKTAAHRFHNLGLAMGGGLFFAVDSIPSTALQDPPRQRPARGRRHHGPGAGSPDREGRLVAEDQLSAGRVAVGGRLRPVLRRDRHPAGRQETASDRPGGHDQRLGLQDRQDPLGEKTDRSGAGHPARQDLPQRRRRGSRRPRHGPRPVDRREDRRFSISGQRLQLYHRQPAPDHGSQRHGRLRGHRGEEELQPAEYPFRLQQQPARRRRPVERPQLRDRLRLQLSHPDLLRHGPHARGRRLGRHDAADAPAAAAQPVKVACHLDLRDRKAYFCAGDAVWPKYSAEYQDLWRREFECGRMP